MTRARTSPFTQATGLCAGVPSATLRKGWSVLLIWSATTS